MRTRLALCTALYLALALLALAPAARAESPGTQRFVVPLSHPGQPVKLEVSLIGGSISIRPSSGNEVTVEAIAEDKDDDEDQDAFGQPADRARRAELDPSAAEPEVVTGEARREDQPASRADT